MAGKKLNEVGVLEHETLNRLEINRELHRPVQPSKKKKKKGISGRFGRDIES